MSFGRDNNGLLVWPKDYQVQRRCASPRGSAAILSLLLHRFMLKCFVINRRSWGIRGHPTVGNFYILMKSRDVCCFCFVGIVVDEIIEMSQVNF